MSISTEIDIPRKSEFVATTINRVLFLLRRKIKLKIGNRIGMISIKIGKISIKIDFGSR